MLEVGQTFDRYRVVQVLGEGGMAVVYRVEHATLGTQHALKVLTVDKASIRDRLVMEGRVQASLRHPNIVQVHDVLTVGSAPALLMEYIDGPGLDEWLANYRPTIPEALSIFRGIVAGVGFAHAKGLVHRDLKPANVLLAVTDEGVQPRVADFGLVKVDAANMKRTRTGMTMGTPAYMAPEQIRDSGSVDRRADLYSLGCLLYELVTGRPPYDATDLLELFSAVKAGAYPAPESLNAEVPPAVSAAIAGLIRVDPQQRIPDCASLLDALEGLPWAPAELGPPPRRATDRARRRHHASAGHGRRHHHARHDPRGARDVQPVQRLALDDRRPTQGWRCHDHR
jgi:serine/threonine protein kinase